MDMREASAMTEASGLADGETTFSSGASRQEGQAARIADQLRRMTVAAPLQSLLVAFLLGLFIARRR
jgi:hypothetical protein